MTVDLSELFAQFHGNGAFVGAGDVDTSFGGSGFSDFSDAERSRGFSDSCSNAMRKNATRSSTSLCFYNAAAIATMSKSL
jgi:hypothetical protein